MSTQQQNKAIARDCYAQAAAGNFDALPGLLGDDYVMHPEGIRGADGLAEMVHVLSRFTIRGRHVTGNDVEFTGLTVSRHGDDGKIEEEWEIIDVMTLLGQIGQLPEGATA